MLDNWYKVLMEYSIWFPPEIHGQCRLKTSIFCSSTHRALHKSGELSHRGAFLEDLASLSVFCLVNMPWITFLSNAFLRVELWTLTFTGVGETCKPLDVFMEFFIAAQLYAAPLGWFRQDSCSWESLVLAQSSPFQTYIPWPWIDGTLEFYKWLYGLIQTDSHYWFMEILRFFWATHNTPVESMRWELQCNEGS